MRKVVRKIEFLSASLTIALISGSAALALSSQATIHSQSTTNTSVTSSNASVSSDQSTQVSSSQSNNQTHLSEGKLKSCLNREKTINNILSRIDIRTQKQLNLFGTIATRVEGFYTLKGKTVTNYNQLVASVATAKAQAEKDYIAMQTNSSFSCEVTNPKGIVINFKAYLKTEITDLQNYRNAVKNLIVAVASANSANVSTSNQTSSQTEVK